MSGQIIGEIDHTDTQCTPSHRTAPGGGNRVILIVKQGIQRTHGQRSQFLKFVKRLNGPQIERRQGTQRDFTVLIAKIRQRFRRQRDLQTQIGLVNRGDRRIERTVRIAVIDILDINPACRALSCIMRENSSTAFTRFLRIVPSASYCRYRRSNAF